SIAKLFIEEGIHVIGLSRQNSVTLQSHAENHQASYFHITCDLRQTAQLKRGLSDIDALLPAEGLDTLYLINNAAAVEPIDQAMRLGSDDLADHVHVNT